MICSFIYWLESRTFSYHNIYKVDFPKKIRGKTKRFWHRISDVEHSKIVNKFSKSIESQIKVYTESKVADQMLQLNLIRKHILPKKYLQCEIKIVNFQRYDDQLKIFH